MGGMKLHAQDSERFWHEGTMIPGQPICIRRHWLYLFEALGEYDHRRLFPLHTRANLSEFGGIASGHLWVEQISANRDEERWEIVVCLQESTSSRLCTSPRVMDTQTGEVRTLSIPLYKGVEFSDYLPRVKDFAPADGVTFAEPEIASRVYA